MLRCSLALALAAAALLTGCARGPVVVPSAQQLPIDRVVVEYPTGYDLTPYIQNLTAPTAIAFDDNGNLLVAESGLDERDPRILGFRPDGTTFQLYPPPRGIDIDLPFGLGNRFRIYGPVGGMVAYQGRVYVSHRDADDRGVITAISYTGVPETIVADLPAQGDFGITDLAISPTGRLYFGVGSATNSGVVGLDNWAAGWVRRHPDFHDRSWYNLKLTGYRFDTRNPRAGLFTGGDIAVTAPFQPFDTSNRTRIAAVNNNKPGAAIYSISPGGGDLRVEAHGVRYPRGLAFNEFGRLFITNNGMELRGTRPIKDDPDALLKFVPGAWYGWPDYSADLLPVTETRFQPPTEMISKSGYPDVGFVIDHQASGLVRPDRNALLQSAFPSLSGAAKMDFVPPAGPFEEYRGSVIIALAGDRAPFATSGLKTLSPRGYRLVRVDESRQVHDFVVNTEGQPASQLDDKTARRIAMERPVDLKFGPDGALYILDMGEIDYRNGDLRVRPRTGRVYRLVPETMTPAAEDTSEM